MGRPIRCSVHRNKPCPDPVVKGCGTYCRSTGVELSGPQLVATDWSSYSGNNVHGKLNSNAVARRRTKSIAARLREALSVGAFQKAVTELYGRNSKARCAAVMRSRKKIARKNKAATEYTLVAIMRAHRLETAAMSPGISNHAAIDGIAQALSTLAAARANPRQTYAALRAFPRLFAATVMDGMVVGVGRTLPALQAAAAYRIAPDQFKAMGINCRAMSAIAKSLKVAAPLHGWGEKLLAAEARGWT